MESLYAVPYSVLECPNLKLKRPSWFHMPSGMVVFACILFSYFLVTGGMHDKFKRPTVCKDIVK